MSGDIGCERPFERKERGEFLQTVVEFSQLAAVSLVENLVSVPEYGQYIFARVSVFGDDLPQLWNHFNSQGLSGLSSGVIDSSLHDVFISETGHATEKF